MKKLSKILLPISIVMLLASLVVYLFIGNNISLQINTTGKYIKEFLFSNSSYLKLELLLVLVCLTILSIIKAILRRKNDNTGFINLVMVILFEGIFIVMLRNYLVDLVKSKDILSFIAMGLYAVHLILLVIIIFVEDVKSTNESLCYRRQPLSIYIISILFLAAALAVILSVKTGVSFLGVIFNDTFNYMFNFNKTWNGADVRNVIILIVLFMITLGILWATIRRKRSLIPVYYVMLGVLCGALFVANKTHFKETFINYILKDSLVSNVIAFVVLVFILLFMIVFVFETIEALAQLFDKNEVKHLVSNSNTNNEPKEVKVIKALDLEEDEDDVDALDDEEDDEDDDEEDEEGPSNNQVIDLDNDEAEEDEDEDIEDDDDIEEDEDDEDEDDEDDEDEDQVEEDIDDLDEESASRELLQRRREEIRRRILAARNNASDDEDEVVLEEDNDNESDEIIEEEIIEDEIVDEDVIDDEVVEEEILDEDDDDEEDEEDEADEISDAYEESVMYDDEIEDEDDDDEDDDDEDDDDEEDVVIEESQKKVTFSKIKSKPLSDKLVTVLDDEKKERYNRVRNELQSYKLVRERLSKKGDSYRFHGALIAKISISGKTLRLHLALDPLKFAGTKYNFIDLAHKSQYAEVPMTIKLTSNRSVKYALELITKLANRFDLDKNPKYKEQDYMGQIEVEFASRNNE